MTQLRRELSLFDLTMIAVGSTIGSGIFLTPSLIAHELQAPVWILLAWVCGGLMALSGALTLSELGAMMPEAGGIYVYLRRTYGSLTGFLFGWAYFLVVNTGGIAALGIAFATYLSYMFPLGSTGITAVAIAGIVILTAINVLGVKAGGIFSDIFTMLKLAGIAGLIIVGFVWGSSSTTDFSSIGRDVPGRVRQRLFARHGGRPLVDRRMATRHLYLRGSKEPATQPPARNDPCRDDHHAHLYPDHHRAPLPDDPRADGRIRSSCRRRHRRCAGRSWRNSNRAGCLHLHVRHNGHLHADRSHASTTPWRRMGCSSEGWRGFIPVIRHPHLRSSSSLSGRSC